MVQAFVNITDHANRIINIIKARYGLRDKSEAINILTEKYEEFVLEPELKPEYIKKALKIQSKKAISVGTLKNLRKRHSG